MHPSFSIDGDKIYSVDMMFAYIKIYKPKIEKVPVSSFLFTLKSNTWSNYKTGKYFSAMEVITKPKKYKSNMNRIKKADLKYPIIINKNTGSVIDGVHRLSKAYMEDKKYIKAYVFSQKIINKFIVDRKQDWNKIENMEVFDYIELFHKRFC